MTRKGGDMGREKGRKEKKTHKILAESQQVRNKQTKKALETISWVYPQPRQEESISASKVLGDAALLWLLAGLEKLSLTSAGIHLRDNSFSLAFGSPQKWGPLQLASAVNQLHSLFVHSLVNWPFLFSFFSNFCTASEVQVLQKLNAPLSKQGIYQKRGLQSCTFSFTDLWALSTPAHLLWEGLPSTIKKGEGKKPKHNTFFNEFVVGSISYGQRWS